MRDEVMRAMIQPSAQRGKQNRKQIAATAVINSGCDELPKRGGQRFARKEIGPVE
jgi:hypothetical protein